MLFGAKCAFYQVPTFERRRLRSSFKFAAATENHWVSRKKKKSPKRWQQKSPAISNIRFPTIFSALESTLLWYLPISFITILGLYMIFVPHTINWLALEGQWYSEGPRDESIISAYLFQMGTQCMSICCTPAGLMSALEGRTVHSSWIIIWICIFLLLISQRIFKLFLINFTLHAATFPYYCHKYVLIVMLI